jgi:hypothetical protein
MEVKVSLVMVERLQYGRHLVPLDMLGLFVLRVLQGLIRVTFSIVNVQIVKTCLKEP